MSEQQTQKGKEMSEFGMKTLENIGKNVKFTRRNLLDVTLNSMAKNTGISRDVICRLEYLSDGTLSKETVYPSISTVIKFCEGVGVSLSDLFDKIFQEDLEVQGKILEHCKWKDNKENSDEDASI